MSRPLEPGATGGPPAFVPPTPAPARAQDSIGRSLAILSGTTAIQQVSAFVLSILLRGVLGPAKTGIWNLVEVWRQQLSSASLGASQAADRDMPVLRGRGEHAEEAEVRSVAFTFTLGEAGVVALGFVVYWIAARDSFEPTLALGLALVPLMSVLTSYVSLYQLFLKNLKEFRLYSALFLVQAVLDWSTLPLAIFGGVEALLIGLAAGWIVRAYLHYLLIRRRGLFRVWFTLRKPVLVPMLRFGVLLSLTGLAQQLLLRLDSLVIGLSAGTTQLGYYFLGPQVAAAAAAVPLSLAVIAWPNLMSTYGAGGTPELRAHLERYLRPIGLVISPLVAAIGVFGVAVLVNGFLPDFERGLSAMKIFILTVVFVHSVSLLHQVLIAVRKVVLLLVLTLLAVVVQVTVLGLGSIGGLSLTTAAWSAVAGQATLALLLLVAVTRLLDVHAGDVRRFYGRVPLIWGLSLALIAGLDVLAPATTGLFQSLAVAAAQIVGFVVVAVPLFTLVDRDALRESRSLLRGVR
jgi:O-antigen/teichoic acid export membrane protein